MSTATNEYLLRDIGILALVPDYWNGLWQPRHHVLSRLAQYFDVVWYNPAHGRQDILARGTIAAKGGINQSELPGFFVYTPEWWLPKLHRWDWLARLTFRQQLERGRRWLIGRGCKRIILYIWRPEFDNALDLFQWDLSCYHIDDEYSFSDVETQLEESEKRLIQRVDQVFIHSPGLLERKGTINPHTLFIPNGVNYRAYAKISVQPPDIEPIPHPRVGYTGVIKRQLDWPLLLYLTLRHPEWSFVFVGPQGPHPELQDTIKELSLRANVYFLGAKSVQELATYPQHFDVCIMPYRMNAYTKYIYPLKLHEYLASGRPTVGTRIRSLEEFADIIALVSTPDEWSAAITAALNPTMHVAERCVARQAIAQRYDWDLLVLQIARAIVGRLGWEFADQLEQSLIAHPKHICVEI